MIQDTGLPSPASTDDSSRVNVQLLCGYRFKMASKNVDTFDLQDLPSGRLSAKHSYFPALTCTTTFGTALALGRDAMLRFSCEAVMWKITTRGFTLAEVLIMAAMNLKTSGDSAAKHEKRASRN
jgi:hypothetical protein